ncbi:Uncharacterised protein [Actinobaculum suis]|uniref:HTH cro/C1-type domain-containing protein n=1 Tax=Actinobaculum suis TaxID=1657 RepID=A0A7Z8YAF8_9ACTO|nr:Uncharacterised protein [Actinobaculum suis]
MEPIELSGYLARGIRTLLKSERCSTQRASEKTGIPYSTLHRKLSGVGDFRYSEIAALAALLELTPANLIAAATAIGRPRCEAKAA